MVVTIDAAHQARREVEVTTEGLTHIIIKLVAVGACMHDDDGAVELVGIRRELLFHVIEVRHGSHIVILCGIRVQTEKLHTASDKREIESTVHHLIRLIASSQEVVVTDQGHEGIVQTVENVARPLELVIGGGIRQVLIKATRRVFLSANFDSMTFICFALMSFSPCTFTS